MKYHPVKSMKLNSMCLHSNKSKVANKSTAIAIQSKSNHNSVQIRRLSNSIHSSYSLTGRDCIPYKRCIVRSINYEILLADWLLQPYGFILNLQCFAIILLQDLLCVKARRIRKKIILTLYRLVSLFRCMNLKQMSGKITKMFNHVNQYKLILFISFLFCF